MSLYFDYPRIPHLWGSRACPDDEVYSEVETKAFFARYASISVREKLDGFNLAIGFDGPYQLRIFHRGMDLHKVFVPWSPPALIWLESRLPQLYDSLGEEWVLCGEWLDHHSPVGYTDQRQLYAFDLYHLPDAYFASSNRLKEFCKTHALASTPVLYQGPVQDVDAAWAFLGQSSLGTNTAEGLILYGEVDGVVQEQVKMVRPDFEKWPLPEPMLWQERKRLAKKEDKP